MKNKWFYSLICAALAAGMMIMPVCAEDAEAVTEDVTETAQEAAADESAQIWESSSNLEDGIFTVYIKSHADDKKGYYWTWYTGEKGDATLYDLLTQSDQEEGSAYVGSFMALEGETGDDYIRIAHTNGFVVDQYMDFDIRIEDGKITENTGGSHALPTTDAEFDTVISGDWQAEDGSNVFLTLSLNPEGGFDGVVSDGSGKDGVTQLYTFTAEYDAISGAFMYRNGSFEAAQITDGSEPETEEPAETAEGEGTGLIAFDPASEGIENLKLIFHDLGYTEEDIVFARAK